MIKRRDLHSELIEERERSLSTSTRLIVLLVAMIGLVMSVAGYYRIRQRQLILANALQNEALAHATTLQLVLENEYRAGRIKEAQRSINQLSESPKIYSVTLFDDQERVVLVSSPFTAAEIGKPLELKEVIATGKMAETSRRIGNEEVFSIISPIRVNGNHYGAFEITQPRSLIKADFARARLDIGLTTLTLFLTVALVVWVVTRRNLSRPIKELLDGAEALGRGNLQYRVIVPEGGNEFNRLARAFNRMAERLEDQRIATLHEAEERVSLERELRHSERLASVGRLAAGVAHEMGAPLNVIKGRAEQLLERIDGSASDSNEKIRRNLTIITEQADGIARIVRQLLNLARPFKLKRGPVELSVSMARVLELIEAEAAKNHVAVDFARQDGVFVEADAELLHQVLMNVCLNGIQAMPDGGRLRLEVLQQNAVKENRSFAAVRISDTGTGIAVEHLPHIFDPFFTTKEVGKGTGLGLAVSHRIIEEHGGWIEATSLPLGGAAFTIYLPKMQFANEQVTARPGVGLAGQTEKALSFDQ